MMVQSKRAVEYTGTYTEEEVVWLRGYLQNYQGPGEEPIEDQIMREKFFNALDVAIKREIK